MLSEAYIRIEALAATGDGYLLWAGCAAGDTDGALVLKVG